MAVLFAVPPKYMKESDPLHFIGGLLASISDSLETYVQSYDVVSSMEEYLNLSEEKRMSYDIIVG